jgi:hypothetical protein
MRSRGLYCTEVEVVQRSGGFDCTTHCGINSCIPSQSCFIDLDGKGGKKGEKLHPVSPW